LRPGEYTDDLARIIAELQGLLQIQQFLPQRFVYTNAGHDAS